MDKTNMLLIMALAIYDSIDVAVMIFLLALVVRREANGNVVCL